MKRGFIDRAACRVHGESVAGFRLVKTSTVCGLALFAGLAVAGSPAWAAEPLAQGPAPTASDDAGNASGQVGGAASLDEIQVTGSRIRRTGMNTPTPVTVMSADQLGTMAPGNMIDALDQVPQFFNNNSPNTAASKADSAGASNANLRGLGAKRTLVLLNGNRVVPSNRLGNIDINLFPDDLISRVEVVTGGASAAYGTDAVAGVVNFILDTDFTGVKGHAQGGMTSRSDNENFEVGLTAGSDIGDRMHFTVSGGHSEANRIDNLAGRDWYQGWGLVTNPEWTASGGATGPRLLVRPHVNSTQYTNGGLIDAPGTSIDRLQFLSDGTATPFKLGDPYVIGTGTRSQSGGSGYNAYDYDTNVHTDAYPQGTRSGSFVPATRRTNAFAYLDYDVTDDINVYVQGLWGYNYANSVGTLPLGHGSWALTAFQGNPYLPDDIAQAMADEGIDSFKLQRYHTAADIAQDRLILKNNTYSLATGFKADLHGDMLDGWQLTGHYQIGWNHNHLDFENFLRNDRLPLAMDAVVDPVTGGTVCNITVMNPGSGFDDCVPIDLFGVGRASQEAIDWVQGSMFVQANTKQDNVEFAANGNIFEGWGAGPVSMAVGASYRKQSITHRLGPDDLMALDSLVNDPANGIRGIPPSFAAQDEVLEFVNLEEYEGSFNVKELFVETLVPLVANTGFAQRLDLNLAARWADYSGSGGIWAWKAGLDWQVIDDVRLRGTLSRDVRAGSLEERFDRQGQGAAVEDPEFNDLNYTTTQIRGGNPNVNPEKSDTITLGAVYQPSFIDGLSVSVDWYDIKVKGAIDLLGVQRIVDDCNDFGGAICDRVHRDPGTNRISLVENTFINLGKVTARGVDVELTYSKAMTLFGGGAESLTGRMLASWLDEYSTTDVDGNKVDHTDELGVAGAAYPDLRVTANLTYANGPFSIFVQERFIGGGIIDVDYVEGVDIADNSVGSVFYTDLNLSYRPGGADSAWKVYFNITNLFDRDPPLIPSWSDFSGTGAGTNDTLYDALGRRFVLGASFQY